MLIYKKSKCQFMQLKIKTNFMQYIYIYIYIYILKQKYQTHVIKNQNTKLMQ